MEFGLPLDEYLEANKGKIENENFNKLILEPILLIGKLYE